MSHSYVYISDGKMFAHTDTGDRPIDSEVLETYIRKVRDSANRSEWKRSGSGAMFTGVYEPGADAQSRVASIRSAVGCVGWQGEDLIYSIDIDGTAGIYRKFKNDDTQDGIVISSSDTAYLDFDFLGQRLAVSAAFAGESHIGVLEAGKTVCDMYTDGQSWDSEPAWSRVNPNEIYFSSAGLAVQEANNESNVSPLGFPYGMHHAMLSTVTSLKGPSAICRMNIVKGTMDVLLENNESDFVHPQPTADGSLYYIKRPYRSQNDTSSSGCLLDALLMPFRLLRALFGFFNLFSVKYSGKTLSRSGDVKQRDEGQMFIDGNMIQAEKELKENQKRGEQYPGIIPRTWELRRLGADGTDTLIRRGVVAYRVMGNGDILISNGMCVLCRGADGSEHKISSAQRVTFLNC
jgi:hypothetical protein